MAIKPKVLVFDLDHTLWPFFVHSFTPPFRKTSNGSVVDSSGREVTHYDEASAVLGDLYEKDYLLAVASRTAEIKGARKLIEALGWKQFFSNQQIFPGQKTKHLTNIKNTLGVEFSDIIFFDDEGMNIYYVEKLGVFSVYVHNGITKKAVDDALSQFATKRACK